MSKTTTYLTKLQSTVVDFYFTYKYFHWNLVAQDFPQFHKLFDEHASTVFESVDVIAERVRQLDGEAIGSLSHYLQNTILNPEKPHIVDNLQGILKYIFEQHSSIIKLLEEIIDYASETKDFSTADLLTKFLEEHQQMRWFIKSSMR
jgi:starvation-inducible DNA-binding protein